MGEVAKPQSKDEEKGRSKRKSERFDIIAKAV
jgi:hypothetical protein